MFRTIHILFIFLLTFNAFGQEKEKNFNLAYPEFISSNSSFDISITVTNSFPEADEFELFIIPENKITITRAEYKSVYESSKLDFHDIKQDEFFNEIYSIEIDLSDSLKSDGTVFQVLLNLNANQTRNAKIKFKGMFKNNDSTIAYLSNESFDLLTDENFVVADLEFYKPQKISEKALQFGENSFFNISLEKQFEHNILIDFWIKFSDAGIDFLKLFRKDFIESDFKMSINKFQMMSVSSEQYNSAYLKPYFASRKSWYHVSILISKENARLYVYCNDILVAENDIQGMADTKNWELAFVNSTKGKSFTIDLLRIIDLNNSINISFNTKHSVYFNSDSSLPAAIYKFDSSDEFLLPNEKVKHEFSNVKFVKSDAPLFTRSPELNINLLGSAYELEWSGGDYKQAQYYVLEKSLGNKPYVEVFTVQSDNTNEKSYSFIDVVDATSDVVYYRVKQLNYDGSKVYSSQVKVGQGESEPFTIGQNYPNPFNPKTSIEIEMLEDNEIQITVYSLDGREISRLYKGYLQKGLHRFSFDGEGLPSGIYMYKVEAPEFTQTKKMILTK